MWGHRSRALAIAPFALVALGLALVGCNASVADALDEGDANRIVVTLDRANIDALKETDPEAEGKFRVSVPRDDTARALLAMKEEELPRPKPQGVLDSLGKGSIVPSAQTEHAQFVAGLAGDLERTLEGVDGVLSARVHLNVAMPDPFHDGPAPKTTASVLVAHRGATPPLATDAVQRIVAGGVTGLAASDVAVVMVTRPARAEGAPAGIGLAHVGPIAVAPASARALQMAFALLVLLVAAFAASTLAFYTRLVRLREAVEEP